MSRSDSRPALVNRTNVYANNTSSPWSASIKVGGGLKRPVSEIGGTGGLKKRLKVNEGPKENLSGDDSNSDVETEDIKTVAVRGRRGRMFGMMSVASRAVPSARSALRTSPSFAIFLKLMVYQRAQGQY